MSGDSAEALAARYGPAYRWLVTAAGMIGTVSMVLSMTTVNVAVPDVMGAFGIGQDKAQLMASSYMATMTAGMLLNAWVVSVLGERRAFLLSLGLFSCGAVMGGLAPNEDVLILGRVLQGGAAGIGQPLVMAAIFLVFPPERRGTAMGIFGLGVVFAPAIGPTLGGMMIELFSWRYVFFISLPFCLVSMVMGSLFMPSRPLPKEWPSFDWTGFALLCTGLFGIMSGIAMGQREGWNSDEVVLRLSIGGGAALAFILWELRVEKPLLEIRIFANREFAAATAVAFMFGAGMLGSTYIIPVFVQTVQSYTPLRAGLLMMPAGLLLAFIFPLAGRVSDMVSPAVPIMGGLAVFAMGFAMMSFADVDTPFWTFAMYILLSRAGLGFINPSLNASALKALPPDKVRQASGAVNFCRQLGGAFGTNFLVAALEMRTRFHAEALTATQDYANRASDALISQMKRLLAIGGVPETQLKENALDFLGKVVHAQSTGMAFQDTFLIVCAMAVVTLVPAWMLGRSQRVAKPALQVLPRTM